MDYRVQNTKTLSTPEMINILHKSAKLYAEYAETNLLFIFRENKADSYDYYETYFGKNNFMHLAGIKSKSLSAVEFYEACLLGTIKKEDCNPRKNYTTMYSKIAVMMQLLDLRNSKCYKIAEKDLATRDNDFEMATGNQQGIIGYDSRIRFSNTSGVAKKYLPIPTTLLNNPISHYCSKPQKIMYILQKDKKSKKYCHLFYEIKKGLFIAERDNFKIELLEMIDSSMFIIS